MGTEPGPESKIWRLTGFGVGSEILVSDPKSISLTPLISVTGQLQNQDYFQVVYCNTADQRFYTTCAVAIHTV